MAKYALTKAQKKQKKAWIKEEMGGHTFSPNAIIKTAKKNWLPEKGPIRRRATKIATGVALVGGTEPLIAIFLHFSTTCLLVTIL